MEKRNVFDYAKWFIDNNLDNPRDTFKGNMKLQKLLFFAQLISLAKNNKLLFDDCFCAFASGMVMENVRLEYKNNLNGLLNYKGNDLTKEDIEILELTKEIYGSGDADTLSNMTQQFSYFKNKNKSVVPNKELKKELDNIKDVLYAYEIMNSDEYKNKKLLLI